MRWPVQYCCYVLEMHIFSNTHLKGLYNSYRSRHRTCMSATTRTVSSQCTHACSANTLNHRTVFFFLRKTKEEEEGWKRAYSARETLYQKVRRCPSPAWEFKKKRKKKSGLLYLYTGNEGSLQKAALHGEGGWRAAAMSSKQQRSEASACFCAMHRFSQGE